MKQKILNSATLTTEWSIIYGYIEYCHFVLHDVNYCGYFIILIFVKIFLLYNIISHDIFNLYILLITSQLSLHNK